MTEERLPKRVCNQVNTTYTCAQCVKDGHAHYFEKWDDTLRVRCPYWPRDFHPDQRCELSKDYAAYLRGNLAVVEAVLRSQRLAREKENEHSNNVQTKIEWAELPLGGEIVEETEDQP